LSTALLTALTMVAFASNSLLTRGALGAGAIDASGFALVRLATGSLTLALLLRARSRPRTGGGSWLSAAALAGYAVAFTLAYETIGAGIGALLLFAAVQVTMIGAGIWRGERPRARDWGGFGLAFGGLLWLTLPGAARPSLAGAALMIAAGICWGGYSLAGRSSRNSLAATAGNFWRASILAAFAFLLIAPPAHATGLGIGMAAASGALASGVGYTIWYAVLPRLAAWRAALVQLTVPVLTALAAVPLLGESVTSRLGVATALVAAGVWLAISPGNARS
jgi:drug/metabolite transporter (DMT)-like permease